MQTGKDWLDLIIEYYMLYVSMAKLGSAFV